MRVETSGKEKLTVRRKHQTRLYISSMGPDPILDSWKLCDSPYDTLNWISEKNAFYLPKISDSARHAFCEFDTLDFYNAYLKEVQAILDSEAYPTPSKNALLREHHDSKNEAAEVLVWSNAEVHSIVLEFYEGKKRKRVIVIVYPHIG